MKVFLVRNVSETLSEGKCEAFVAIAPDEEAVRHLHPSTTDRFEWQGFYWINGENLDFTEDWCSPSDAIVVLLGEAVRGAQSGIILRSFK